MPLSLDLGDEDGCLQTTCRRSAADCSILAAGRASYPSASSHFCQRAVIHADNIKIGARKSVVRVRLRTNDYGMEIREIKASDSDFGAWSDVHRKSSVADDPTGPLWRDSELRVVYDPHEHRDIKLWLAEDADVAVGAAALSLPMHDNLHLGEVEIYVRPESRRRGIGTALLNLLEQAADEYGRSSVLTYMSSSIQTPDTPGSLFAERHGFTFRLTEIRRVQRPPFPIDEIAKAVDAAQPYAADYEIVTWRDRTPDDYIDEYARLEARLSTDAPLGDMEYEGEVWDESRIRNSEERSARMHRDAWNAVAMAPDGSMAGMTRVVIPRDSDEHGYQDSTIVDPQHRGHRLGLLLKATNFDNFYRDRPGIQAIWTWNAESNAHMIAVNETMGYRVEGWDKMYQRDVRRAGD